MEAKQYCLDNAPPCKPGEVPESLFTDLLKIYFNSEDPKCVATAALALYQTHLCPFSPDAFDVASSHHLGLSRARYDVECKVTR